MHVLILKMAGSHFLLTSAAHLSFHTSLSQVTTGQSKCLCIRTNGWGQEGNSQFSQQCCQHIGVATSSVSPLSLCCCIMLSRAQMWLRVQAINDVMFVQQQVPRAKPCAQRGGQVQAPVNLPQVQTNSL